MSSSPPSDDTPSGKAKHAADDQRVLSLAERKALRAEAAEATQAARKAERRAARRAEQQDGGQGAGRPGLRQGPGGGGGGGGQQSARAGQRARAAQIAAQQEDEDEHPQQSSGASTYKIPAPAALSRTRPRHIGVIFAFIYIVLIPTAASWWYMDARAADRYASYSGFSVRTEEVSSASDLLGGLAALGTSSSSDTDILSQYIQSQELVRRVDARLDLRRLWSKGDPERDPLFVYHAPGTIEDLHSYWKRMVKVYISGGSGGLIDLEVQAFTPQDAHDIAEAIYDESTTLINRLSDIAQADGTRFAREELDTAVERLKSAREAITLFRNEHQIVDPQASIQSQMGLLGSLQQQLANTLIDLDILRQTAADSDPRVTQAERRVEVIEARIAEERTKLGFGAGAPGQQSSGANEAFADLIGDFERLSVDLQFAEQSYTAALAAFDAAQAETQRQSRYLAAHIGPTMPEASEYPQRGTVVALVGLFAFLLWAISVIFAYALKDRR